VFVQEQYLDLVTELKLSKAIEQQLCSFMDGFHSVIPHGIISIFNEYELELLMSGLPQIDIDDWERHTNYVGYTADSEQIKWFWEFVRSLDQETAAQLLQFTSGSARVPLGGFAALRGVQGIRHFSIGVATEADDGSLPTANTCFNSMKLPAYSSKEVLAKRLLVAIKHGREGFVFA